MANFKPTLKEPMSPQSEKFEKDFKKTMVKTAPDIAPTINLNETDSMLSEVEQSLKKKIFSLAKMEALVFSDPKLSSVYEGMAENGEEKYGYHYNETIQNMIFNDYVLNSPKYLQKYKMAIPKEKKRRDKSGINQLKKAGEKKMTQSGLPKLQKTEVTEGDEPVTKVVFLVNERDPKDPDLFAYFPEENHDREGKYKTAYSHIGQHSSATPEYAKESRLATPEEYQDLKSELENQVGYNLEVLNGMQESTSASSAGGAAGYVGYAGPAAWSKKGDLSGDFKGNARPDNLGKAMSKPISRVISITESDYLTDPSGFEKYVQELNEQSDANFILNKSDAYGSVNNMSPENQKVIKKDITSGKWDDNSNIKGGLALQEQGVGKLTTVEQVKALGRKLTKEDIPNLAGEALYKIAVNLANRMLPIGWDELPDVNSMWDYIDENGGMTYEQLVEGVKEGCNDRLADEGMSLDDLNEKAKSKAQQRFMGMVHAVQKGDLPASKVGGDVERAAKSMTDKDAEDFASTKHKGLPDHVDEELGQPDIEYLTRLYDLANAGPNHDPAKTERFKQNIPLMDDQQLSQVYKTLENIVRQMGYKPEQMGSLVHEGSPKKLDEFLSLHDTVEYVSDRSGENVFEMNGHRWQFVNAKYPDGKIDIGVYRFGHDLVYDYARWQEEMGINENNIKEDMQTMIQNNGTSMSNKAIATGDQPANVPVGTQQTGGLQESDMKLLEEINKELEAFSIHHDKLKLMSEDKKTPSMVQGDRLRAENPKNFKKDLQHSGTKEIIDVEKELQWKDQQTDVGDEPQELGQDIEKQEIKVADMESGEALKNVGNSTNRPGDEIPKRNLTSDEQAEVDLYRNGQHSLNYDNEPAERFVERMKADQGEFFEMGEKQKEFKKDAPMYDKDSQPIDDGIEKVQFDKNNKKKGDRVAWNERMGIESNVKLGESMITGRYIDILGKRRLIEFRLSESVIAENVEDLFPLDFTGLGNTYNSKTVDKKVVVNEAVVNAMASHKFYTDGKSVVAVKNPVQTLNEGEVKEEKPVINEQMDKMKHLLGYKPETFTNTSNVKKNRGF